MLLFLKADLMFLAVPRTGTTAVEAAFRDRADIAVLAPPGAKHMTLRRARRAAADLLGAERAARLATVAVVRDPVDRLLSWYRYRRRPEIAGMPASTADVPLARFVEAVLSGSDAPWAAVGRQVRFLAGGGVAAHAAGARGGSATPPDRAEDGAGCGPPPDFGLSAGAAAPDPRAGTHGAPDPRAAVPAGADHLFAFEHLDELAAFLAGALGGGPSVLPVRNAAPRPAGVEDAASLPAPLAAAVRAAFAEDAALHARALTRALQNL